MDDFFTSAVIFGIMLATLRIATPLLLTALGELVCESSGILNLSLEGTMTMGAFAGFYIANETGSLLPDWWRQASAASSPGPTDGADDRYRQGEPGGGPASPSISWASAWRSSGTARCTRPGAASKSRPWRH